MMDDMKIGAAKTTRAELAMQSCRFALNSADWEASSTKYVAYSDAQAEGEKPEDRFDEFLELPNGKTIRRVECSLEGDRYEAKYELYDAVATEAKAKKAAKKKAVKRIKELEEALSE